ncbi:MAG: TonB-dependent receptor [Saprospiraceae bacterium]|nr:TonB-dependent receptor [Candidatus Vicinibacter affinis]MBP6172499.1 TonB-dependent receptor [Saprospiraceae bacterium]MBP6521441.1 TonB-dependent receptor [Saprospiraceae bacterium]HQX45200.1 TonB-dependent receptor [Saprospiraceae bacterium]
MLKYIGIFLGLFFSNLIFSQEEIQDSINGKVLNEITIKGYRPITDIKQLGSIHQTYIIAGKKNEVVLVKDMAANLAEKTGRQIFAKIPGAFIYDMDGSGNQVNISTRGLDPHRSWEYNIRQNGIMINSDLYGYPASHYSPPMEAIEQIELVHGTSSLQYGAEFGGMMNYVVKKADTSKAISFESISSIGSYGLYSTYASLGGKIGKFSYFGYYQKRISNGYRENSNSNSDAQFLNLSYQFNDKLQLSFEVGRSSYVYKIPGPLTDSMFLIDPRQSTRSRNYFNPDITVPSLTLNWQINANTTLNWVLSGVFGTRNSVQFEGFADRPDQIDPITQQYKNRVVDIDQFNSRTSELRILHHYKTRKLRHVLAVGLRYFNNDLSRRQQGKGTVYSDFDLSVLGAFGRDLNYKSQSIALSVENLIYVNDRWSISPGLRYEYGQTDMTGTLSYYDPKETPNRIAHQIPAFGISSQYQIRENLRIYGGISQAYRPVLLKDIIPGSVLERADKDLEDAFGYNAEIGVKAYFKDKLKIELTLFRMRYDHRMGNLVLQDSTGSYTYKTNIGNSLTNGLELYAEFNVLDMPIWRITLFSSTSLMKATYEDAQLAAGTINANISGNEVESVPRWISRNGLNISYKTLSSTLLFSYVDESFSDPLNTIQPTSNGAKGIVPDYAIWDFNLAYKFAKRFILRAGVNNFLNTSYFTKRPVIYPGGGIWSSDGRSFVCSIGFRI